MYRPNKNKKFLTMKKNKKLFIILFLGYILNIYFFYSNIKNSKYKLLNNNILNTVCADNIDDGKIKVYITQNGRKYDFKRYGEGKYRVTILKKSKEVRLKQCRKCAR